MNELDQILEELVRRTADGRLHWMLSAEDDEFVASIGAVSMIVRQQGFDPLRGGRIHQVEILNERGRSVEVIQANTSLDELAFDSPDNLNRVRLLDELYAAARRSALDADATIKQLRESLGIG